jgi:hypothetical protein
MKNKNVMQGIVVLLILAAAGIAAIYQTSPPHGLPSDAAAAEFSAGRAIEHIQAIAQEPRLVGEPGFEAARDYVITELEELGLSPQIQKTRITIPDSQYQAFGWEIDRTQDVENILAKIEGAQSQEAILLVAHLDSTRGPGASDDANGVAVLLETARALLASQPLKNSVILLFNAPEETGLHGSTAFVLEHPWAKEVRVVINFEAGGVSGPSELTNTSPNNGWLIRELARADPYAFGSISSNGTSDSDFNVFKFYGYSGYAFDYARKRLIHSPLDTIQNLHADSIQHQGYHALNLARHFGNLSALQDPRIPNPIYFNAPLLGLVYYPTTWMIPIMALTAGLFLGLAILGFRRKILTAAGMGIGSLVFILCAVIAPFFARLLWALMNRFIPRYQVVYFGQAADLPLLMAIFAGVTIAVMIALYVLARRLRRASLPDLTAGALAVMTLVMIALTYVSPDESFWLTWPLLITLIAVGYWFISMKGDGESFSWVQVVVLITAGAFSILFFLPAIYMDFTGSATNDLYNRMRNLVILAGLLIPIAGIAGVNLFGSKPKQAYARE